MKKSLFASLLACLMLAACGGAERSNGTSAAPSDKLNIFTFHNFIFYCFLLFFLPDSCWIF